MLAMDNNRIIGHKNKIPWKAKGEQALFKRITENSVVIMGRNTFQSTKRSITKSLQCSFK